VVKLYPAIVAASALAAGCGEFEDPAIVLDLRALAMVAYPTEYVIPFDPANPPDPSMVDLDPFEITALVADPAEERPLAWKMTLCAATVERGDGRCAPDHPMTVIGEGTIFDPDTDLSRPVPRAVFKPIGSTYVLLQDAIERDPFAGFSGIDLEVELKVAPVGTDLDNGVAATKRVRFAAKIPEERTPNQNPWLDRIDWDTGGANPNIRPITYGRCVDLQGDPFRGMQMFVDQTLNMMPVEATGVREDYLVPTFEGTSRMFTENISYQWLAGDGSFDTAFTGGPKDPFGNSPSLHAEWQAPTQDEIREDYGEVEYIDVPIWIVQRDERLGAAYFESCVRVLNVTAPF
jgi:hypothetical protein